MSKVTTITTGIDVMKELVDAVPAGPFPEEDLKALRRSAMRLTSVVLMRFPEVR